MTNLTYVGLADCHGIETFVLEEKADNMHLLEIRAMANRQRAATLFKVVLNKKQLKCVKSHLNKKDWVSALKCIKTLQRGDNAKLGTLKELGVGDPELWKKIPDPKMDPWS